MKVALVNQPWNPFVPPVDAGSIAIWNDRVARELAARREDRVAVFGGTDATRPVVLDAEGIGFHAVPLGWDRRIEKWARRRRSDPLRPRVLSRFAWAGFRRRVVRALAAAAPDLVHVHNLAQFLAPIRRALPDATLVLHMHSEWLSQLPHARMAALLAPVDLVVACSPHVADEARRAHPQLGARCVAVPNGVDTTTFTPTDRAPDAPPHVVFVGRLSPEKGLHVLVPAFRRVLAEVPDARLSIVGPEGVTPRSLLADLATDPTLRALGDLANARYAPRLRELAVGLEPQVRFVGPVPQRELAKVYGDADVVVLPSFYESFGVPVIEAMACGRPVVATSAGGLGGLFVDGRSGRFVPVGDEAALATTLIELLRDPQLRARLGAAARNEAVARFAWPRVVDGLEAAWRSARTSRGEGRR